MKKKTNKYVLALVILLILVASVGSVAAYMFKQTGTVNNILISAVVDCKVHEQVNGAPGEITTGNITASSKDSIKIENTGNVKAYLRVKLVSHWEDADGNIVAKASQMPAIDYDDGNWIKGNDDTYYYKNPVDATDGTDLTAELLKTPIELRKSDEGYYQVIEVFAEAIQAEPADAVTEAWGVTVDVNGNLTN